MLRIYDEVIAVVRGLAPVVERLAQRDAALADQVRRALQSVPLNIAEGSGVRAGNRRVHYQRALGSAREVRAGLDAAQAMGYVGALDEATADRIDHLCAVLYKLTR